MADVIANIFFKSTSLLKFNFKKQENTPKHVLSVSALTCLLGVSTFYHAVFCTPGVSNGDVVFPVLVDVFSVSRRSWPEGALLRRYWCLRRAKVGCTLALLKSGYGGCESYLQ